MPNFYYIPCPTCAYFQERTIQSPNGKNGKEILDVCLLRGERCKSDVVALVERTNKPVPYNCPNEYAVLFMGEASIPDP